MKRNPNIFPIQCLAGALFLLIGSAMARAMTKPLEFPIFPFMVLTAWGLAWGMNMGCGVFKPSSIKDKDFGQRMFRLFFYPMLFIFMSFLLLGSPYAPLIYGLLAGVTAALAGAEFRIAFR